MTGLLAISYNVYIFLYQFIFAAIVTFFAYRFSFFTIPKKTKQTKYPPEVSFWQMLFAFGIIFIIGFIVVPIMTYITLLILSDEPLVSPFYQLTKVENAFVNLTVMFLSFICLIAYTYRSELKKSGILKIDNKSFKSFILGIFTWLICYPQIVLLSEILQYFVDNYFLLPREKQTAVKELESLSDAYPLVYFYFAAICVVVPIIEEILFRGFLQSYIRRYLSPLYAISISSLIFTLFHFSYSQGVSNLELLPCLFALSCYLGYLFERQKKLYAPISLHMTFNTISSLTILLNHGFD